MSNPKLCGRQDRGPRQDLRQLAKQGCEWEGVGEPHEHPSGGVGDQRGDFQESEPQRLELRAAPAWRE